MSRLIKVLVALLAIAAIAAPAIAEDRLSLNGELRVRGWSRDNNVDFNDNAGGTAALNDQRFRLGGKIAVSEGVAANFRFDLYDSTWGGTPNTLTDGDNRAYLTINKGMFTLSAGKQGHSIGNAIAVDTNGTGFVLDMAGPITVQLAAFKIAENVTDADDDSDVYTVAVGHKTDLYSGTVFAGLSRVANNTAGADAAETYAYGAAADFKLDAALIKAEINMFDGDNGAAGAANVDNKGLQFYLDGSVAVSKMATVGGIFTYAKGYNGANETQVTDLSDDGSFLPETYGTMATLFNVYPGAAAGKSLNTTFDPTGDGLGVIGLQGYTAVKLTDVLSMKATIFYAETEEDYTAAQKAASTTAYDSFLGGTLSSTYDIASGAAVDTMVTYVTTDAANALTQDDPELIGGFRLRVRF